MLEGLCRPLLCSEVCLSRCTCWSFDHRCGSSYLVVFGSRALSWFIISRWWDLAGGISRVSSSGDASCRLLAFHCSVSLTSIGEASLPRHTLFAVTSGLTASSHGWNLWNCELISPPVASAVWEVRLTHWPVCYVCVRCIWIVMHLSLEFDSIPRMPRCAYVSTSKSQFKIQSISDPSISHKGFSTLIRWEEASSEQPNP